MKKLFALLLAALMLLGILVLMAFMYERMLRILKVK